MWNLAVHYFCDAVIVAPGLTALFSSVLASADSSSSCCAGFVAVYLRVSCPMPATFNKGRPEDPAGADC